MGEGENLRARIQAFRRELEDHLGRVDRLILFGSAARGGRHPDSDVDLLIVSPVFDGMKFYERAAAARRLWHSPVPVDLVCYTPEEFQRLRGQATLVRAAIRDGTEVTAAN